MSKLIYILGFAFLFLQVLGCANAPPVVAQESDSNLKENNQPWQEQCADNLHVRGGRGSSVAVLFCECVGTSMNAFGGNQARILVYTKDEAELALLDARSENLVVTCLQRHAGAQ